MIKLKGTKQMSEKAWNRYYQINLAFEVKKKKKLNIFTKLKCLGLSPVFVKTTVIQKLFNTKEYLWILIINYIFFLLFF